MAYQLSPGVNISEIDLTTIVPAVSTTTGAFVGDFDWGPVNEIHSIGNELELVNMFGKPSSNSFLSFFTAANFLAYGNSLLLVRANTTTMKNATSNATGFLIKNKSEYEDSYYLGATSQVANTNGMFAAKYPGELGNSLKVSVCYNTAGFSSWPYAGNFTSAPGTSTYAATVGGANDEMHVIVVDANGVFGVANTVLEKFSFISKGVDAKNDDGSSNYYVNVLKDVSRFVYAINHAVASNGKSEANTWGTTTTGTAFNTGEANTTGYYTFTLGGGKTGGLATDGQIEGGYDLFNNPETTDISLVMCGAHSQTVSEYVADNIAGGRKDCVAFISPLKEDVLNNQGNEVTDLVSYRNEFNSSSYVVMDNNWKNQFDKYNNVYRWVPLNADIAGLCVYTDQTRDPWFSPAGFNRGQIKNVVKLAWNATKTDRDNLYKVGINPVVNFPGEGAVLYGDKTLLSKPSAFDRINVRRLFIVLEKAISRASRYSLFEFNDAFTRAQFVALVEPFLRDVKGRRGIYDFKVVCDETNNTPEVIDRNEFIGDIYIKPARSINFIQLNFIAVRTGVAFSEVVGKF